MADTAASQPLRVCVRTTLPIDYDMENALVNYLWQQADKQHTDLGYAGAPNSYIYGSFLWKRVAYMQRYRDDFSDRVQLPPELGGELYRLSNKSLNFPKQFVKAHHASATADLESYGFFAVQTEGSEDEDPALPLWERYLRERAKRMELGKNLKNKSARPMLIRGEATCKITQRRKLRVEPRQVKAILDLRDPAKPVPLKDTQGRLVTELDEWVPDPKDPTKKMLARDNHVWWQKDAPFQYSTQKYNVDHVLCDTNGADIRWIHPGDFVFDITQPTLDAAVHNGSVVGEFFMLAVDDLFDMLGAENLTEAGKQYRDTYGTATGNTGGRTAQQTPRPKQGEAAGADDQIVDPHAMPKRLYFEGYFRYDWNKDNRREYVYVLMDWEQRLPIAYDPATLVLNSEQRVQPYLQTCVAQDEFRAYGEGLYEAFNDLSESADASYNRIFIEQQTSGKVTSFEPNGLEQTWAGQKLRLRGPTLWKKRDPLRSLKEIVESVVIPAETQELRQNMALDIQTMVSRGGGVSPAEAESAGLEGAKTATGLQILERQKNKLDASIEDDITDGHTQLVQTWAQVEADAFDVEFARELFGDKMVEVVAPPEALPVGSGLPSLAVVGDGLTEPAPSMQGSGDPSSLMPAAGGMPGQAPLVEAQVMPPGPMKIQKPAVEVLQDWVRRVKPDQMKNLIKLVLVKAKESEVAARADNRVKLITQYAQLMPAMQQALESEYMELLMLNGSTDAEKVLKQIQAATLAQQQQAQMLAMQQQAAAAGGAGAAPPPPEEERPVTGRPDMGAFEPGV